MNFFAHAVGCLDSAERCAGVAVPDWLTMVKPRVRCRTRHAEPWLDNPDEAVAALARGIAQHHADDLWFHQSQAFGELSVEFARRIRVGMGDDDAMRPSFLGHILVELLLDAELIADAPERLSLYYDRIAEVDPTWIAGEVTRMTGRDATSLAEVVERFCAVRFLEDYAEDRRLLFRINQVLRRVRLPQLGPDFVDLLPAARAEIRIRRDALMPAAALC